MAISIASEICILEKMRGIWRIWRNSPRELACCVVTVSFELEHREDDELIWKTSQREALERLLELMGQGVALVHDAEAIKELINSGLAILNRENQLSILWTQWLPTLALRRSFLLRNSQDLEALIASCAWIEYSGTFAIFTKQVDVQFVPRFVSQKWRRDDKFVAVTVLTDWPYWVVISNCYTSEALCSLVDSLFKQSTKSSL